MSTRARSLAAEDVLDEDDQLTFGLAVLSDINLEEHIVSSGNLFLAASHVAGGSSPDHDILCDSILSALEKNSNDASTRCANTGCKLDQIATRSVEQLDGVLKSSAQQESLSLTTTQERLLMAINDVLFREERLLVMPFSIADREALMPSSGLVAGRVTPVSATLLYRGIVSRCDPQLQTEVVADDNEPEQSWLRVSNAARDEHHLVSLCPAQAGTFMRIYPKEQAEKRPRPPNHWTAVLQGLVRAHSKICPCCADSHPTIDWFPEVCTDLLQELKLQRSSEKRLPVF